MTLVAARRARQVRSSAARPGLGAHLGQDPLEPRLGLAVDVGHRRRHRGVHGGDLGVHLVGDGAVAGMALTA